MSTPRGTVARRVTLIRPPTGPGVSAVLKGVNARARRSASSLGRVGSTRGTSGIEALPTLRAEPRDGIVMTRNRLLVVTLLAAAAVSAGVLSAALAVASRNRLLEAVQSRLGGGGLGLLSPLGLWEARLGPAKTIPQEDGGNTYFYWPEHGIAVFAHPHYHGQYARQPREEWRVTSIAIPLEIHLHPHVPPVAETVQVHFERLLDLDIDGRPLRGMGRAEIASHYWAQQDEYGGSCVLTAFPIRALSATLTRLFFRDGQIQEIEIRENRLFAWYD